MDAGHHYFKTHQMKWFSGDIKKKNLIFPPFPQWGFKAQNILKQPLYGGWGLKSHHACSRKGTGSEKT